MIPFSVLLSVYIKENPYYLNDCIESILEKQSLLPNEIILVKDGPLTDDLDKIISYWKGKYPFILKTVNLKNNVGLGDALNIGLSHCQYNWVFRMDTDDNCVYDRFEKQIEYIRANPDIAILGTSIEEFDSSMKESLGHRAVPISNNQIKEYIKRRNPFNHMTVAFRKDVIEKVGSYQHHLYMEDYNLWIRVISSGYLVANLEEILVHVRGGDSMIKRRKGFLYIKSELTLAKLKIDKKIDSPLNSYLIFFLRSIPRLLPTLFLSSIYKALRK